MAREDRVSHADHTATFDATCPTCWGRVKSDNVTLADPLTVDEEPWTMVRYPDADQDRGYVVGLVLLILAFAAGFAAGRLM